MHGKLVFVFGMHDKEIDLVRFDQPPVFLDPVTHHDDFLDRGIELAALIAARQERV